MYINDELTSPANIMECMVNENEICFRIYIWIYMTDFSVLKQIIKFFEIILRRRKNNDDRIIVWYNRGD